MKVELLLLFGASLLFGTLIGALCRRTRVVPPLTGYLLSGVLFGTSGFNLFSDSNWQDIQLLFDLCLGLVVYELGRQIDWRWLRADRSLIYTTLLDGGLTCLLVSLSLAIFSFSPSTSFVIGIIAVQTSPAIVLLVTQQIDAKGYVTRRLLTLTGLNNLLALCLLGLSLPFLKNEVSIIEALELFARFLIAPLLIALLVHFVQFILARQLGIQQRDALLLILGGVAVSVGLALTLQLSVPFSLLWLGMLARNATFRYRLPQVDFNAFMQPFLLVLFVLAGARLSFRSELWMLLVVAMVIVLRASVSASANWLYRQHHLLTTQQCFALGISLAPMSALSISMSHSVLQIAPELNTTVTPLVSQLVAIQHLVAPIAMTLALRWVGEAHQLTPGHAT